MLRAILLGALSVSAVSAMSCKAKTEAVKAEPGAPAGKVLEASGTVSAKRGDATRKLSGGDSVSGDDVIETGSDGHVVVLLDHNNVKWTLGPDNQQRVDQSIAWNQPRSEGSAAQADEATVAAGRPAEKNAATTAATASRADERAREIETAPADKLQNQQPKAPAEPAAQPPPDQKADGFGAGRGVARATAATPPPPKQKPPTPQRVAPPPPPSPPQPEPTPAPGGSSKGGPAHHHAEGRGIGNASGGGPAGPSPLADIEQASLTDVLHAHEVSIRQCLKAGPTQITLLVTVSASGKVTTKVTSKAAVSAALSKCVDAAVKKLELPRSSHATLKVKK